MMLPIIYTPTFLQSSSRRTPPCFTQEGAVLEDAAPDRRNPSREKWLWTPSQGFLSPLVAVGRPFHSSVGVHIQSFVPVNSVLLSDTDQDTILARTSSCLAGHHSHVH